MCLQTDKANKRLGKEPHTALLAPLMSRNSSPAKLSPTLRTPHCKQFRHAVSVDTMDYI